MADSGLFVTLALKASPLRYWTEHTTAIALSLSNDRVFTGIRPETAAFWSHFLLHSKPRLEPVKPLQQHRTEQKGASKFIRAITISNTGNSRQLLVPVRVLRLGSQHNVLQELRVHMPTDTQTCPGRGYIFMYKLDLNLH